jgi:hypothetical protein
MHGTYVSATFGKVTGDLIRYRQPEMVKSPRFSLSGSYASTAVYGIPYSATELPPTVTNRGLGITSHSGVISSSLRAFLQQGHRPGAQLRIR